MEKGKIIFFGEKRTEKMFKEIIENFEAMIQSGDFSSSEEPVQSLIHDLKEAIVDLKSGKTERAISILDWEINRKKLWKKSIIDPSGNQDRINKAQAEIDEVERLRKELE